MNTRSLENRLRRVEATVTAKRLVLKLETGETVHLERLADLRIVFAIMRAQYAEKEGSERVEIPDLARVKLFAQSVPNPNGGQIGYIAKAMSAAYLEANDGTGP